MKLTYTVLHAQIVQTTKEVDHEGQRATLTVERMIVEALPDDGVSGTLTLNLPADTAIAEGGAITISIGEPV
jgi:hypothetical protein